VQRLRNKSAKVKIRFREYSVKINICSRSKSQNNFLKFLSRLLADNGPSLDQQITDPDTEEHLKQF